MKILFLDDAKTRHDSFLWANIGRPIDHAWNYEDAVRLLDANSPYDEVHLDHDLSYEQQEAFCLGAPAPKEKTGTDVADYIAAMSSDKLPKKAILHSFNPPGALRMATILRRVGVPCVIRPFEY